ncbi:MAG: TRAP transporter large permease [Clostridia bacterium]|nr:TRAP transporter large permease [Clostridia bacterium]
MIAAIGIFFVFLLLGMPVAFAIGISGWSFFMIRELPLSIMVQKSISTTQSFTMLAIPLFILAGNLMNATGITKRLMNVANVLCGHMYGSVGQVSCVLSTLMGGVSGSAVADAAMECRILGPEMLRLGYSRGWSAAVNGLSGLIVATIPPSMGLIIYGTTGEVSIGRLFMAGWFPGVLMMTFMMIAVRWSARKFGYKPEREKMAPVSEILKVTLDAIWAILFPILLILLIRFGIMSPTESGAFACAYALFVGLVIYREMTPAIMLQTLKDSVKDVTVIAIILCFSGVFGYGVVFDDLTTTLATALVSITSNRIALLFLVILFLLICGCFMETTVIALILTPILKPVMESVGVDPVVFGMIMMTCVTFGVMTPPVGTGLYTTADIMGCSIGDVVKDGWPFCLAVVLVVVVMVFFPDAVLLLPNLVYGAGGV